MADQKLTELAVASPVTESDRIYVVQSDGSSPPSFTSKQATIQDILDLIDSGAAAVPSTNGFRLTLAPGEPVYNPLRATPSSTDTSAETVTFSADPGWQSGTICTPLSTGGGLTTGTRYYLNRASATVYSFHTTVADALAGTNKVNLTGNVTAVIVPSGISNTTLYLTPYTSNQIALYDGAAAWNILSSAEVSVALGTLSNDTNYDVFAYDNSGTLTLELVAWSSATARSTAIVRQNGAWVKSGSTTKRLVGTIRTNSTTTTIDDFGGLITQAGGKRFVANASNRVRRSLQVIDLAQNWLPSSVGIWVVANSTSNNKVSIVQSLGDLEIEVVSQHAGYSSAAAGKRMATGVGIDSTTVNSAQLMASTYTNVVNQVLSFMGTFRGPVSLGFHDLSWLEYAEASSMALIGANSFGWNAGNFSQSGMTAMVWI